VLKGYETGFLLRTAFLSLFLGSFPASAGVVVSEIMYNPPQGARYEYIELSTTGAAVNLSGWSLDSAVRYTFPAGTVIPEGGRIVVCGNVESFLDAYPDAEPSSVFGPWQGDLDNAGETIMLRTDLGSVAELVRYDDDSPWDFLADGFGSSLERVCLTADPSAPENWRSSPVPGEEGAFGGSPLEPSTVSACPPVEPERPPIRISEIMYHPVLEEDYEDRHEFLEIANAGDSPVDLTGWRIVGGIDFTFPARSIAPGDYLVVAFDREALLEVSEYGLSADKVIGDYGEPSSDGNVRSLDNGGEKIALVTAEGVGVDSVSYDDDWPWPAGADALGAGRSWLPREWLPLEDHRWRGRSLERVSLRWPSNDLCNWVASPLDGATPGRANAGARETPLPAVEEIVLRPAVPHDEDPFLREGDQVAAEVRFSSHGTVSEVKIEYYVEDIDRTDEPHSVLEARDDGVAPDAAAGDYVFTAVFPARPERSIVRYRILGDRGEGPEEISPRPSDPFRWHAYYVSPVIETDTRVYEVFISRTNWARMWSNISGGRVSGCNANPLWNAKVPAVFVHKGKVYDVFARYQGSRWNRRNGPDISPSRWPYPRPSSGPLRALSWHINFPRYDQMEGLRIVILNKLTQSCPGLTSGVGYRFFEEVGLPVPWQRFVRFYVNGGYIRYMQEMERPGETMLRRWLKERREADPDLPPEKVGHFFKSVGCNCDEGPYGWGDSRRLRAACGWSALERYEYTYDPKTYEWAGGGLLMDLLEELNDARSAGTTAMRQFFARNFDIDMLLDYIAIINWAVPFDDMFQNHFFYRRMSDGKWFITPWDLDRDFGFWQGASSSIYMGEQGDSSNRSGWWNYLKDAFLKSYRAEYQERLRELNETLLTPQRMNELIDRVLAEADPTEANRAAAPLSCSFSSAAGTMRNFAVQRQRVVQRAIPKAVADAGPDMRVFAGEEVRFDARASRPDPGPDVTYEWSNGMTGDYPTYVFTEPGTYVITLTITVEGDEFTDSVTVTVLPKPEWAFKERDGLLVMEAESNHQNLDHGEENAWWEEESLRPDYSGRGYMHAADNIRRTFYSNYVERSPELVFYVSFESTGTYFVWVRGISESTRWDTLHVGMDGGERSGSWAQSFEILEGKWQWTGESRSNGRQRLEITSPGLHVFSIWIRESGIYVDKIILTTDENFTPNDPGPPESGQISLVGEGAFVRGDVNEDRKIDISDAVTILRHLFSEPRTICEDHADTNDDGRVDIADAIYLLTYLFLEGDPPPPPFPDMGYDETADGFPCGDKP